MTDSWMTARQPDGRVHVVPNRDTWPHHYGGSGCPCNPDLDGPWNSVVTHRAFDKRDLAEAKCSLRNPQSEG